MYGAIPSKVLKQKNSHYENTSSSFASSSVKNTSFAPSIPFGDPIQCDNCVSQNSQKFCVNCDSFFCSDCFSQLHKTRVLSKHKHFSASKTSQLADLVNGRNDLSSTLSDFLPENNSEEYKEAEKRSKEELEALDIIKEFELALREQINSLKVWDYELLKLKQDLDDSFGEVLQLLTQRIHQIISGTSDLRNRELIPLYKSLDTTTSVSNLLENALKECERVSQSMNHSNVLMGIHLADAILEKAKELQVNYVTEVNSCIVVEGLEIEKNNQLNVIDTIIPKAVTRIENKGQNIYSAAITKLQEGLRGEALNLLQQAARFNYYPSLEMLMNLTSEGIDGPGNVIEALTWAKRAAAHNNVSAEVYFFIGDKFLTGVQDLENAVLWFRKGAELNHSLCLRALALRCNFPPKEALIWLEKGSQAGDLNCQICLAEYFMDLGSFNEASKTLDLAARQGDIEIQFKLAELLDQRMEDYAKAEYWYREAALKNHHISQFRLGIYYEEGKGIEKNHEEALSWFIKAAEGGIPEAQYGAGRLYEWVDIDKAINWYLQAAQNEIPEAQYKLGKLKLPVDESEGITWLEKAASYGRIEAMLALGRHYKKNMLYSDAMFWFTKASDLESADAFFEIGIMHFEGKGTLENIVKAQDFLKKAAELGNADAATIIADSDSLKDAKGDVRRLLRRFLNDLDLKLDPNAVLMPEPALVGYFLKLASSKKYSSWQKRLFILNGPFLTYYRDPTDSYPSVKIPLRSSQLEISSVDEDTGEHKFCIITPERKFQLCTHDPSIFAEWTGSLKRALYFYNFVQPGKADTGLLDNMQNSEDERYSFGKRESAVKSGWLIKQGGKRKNWNKRWCILFNDSLAYFKDPSASSIEGKIPLENSSVELVSERIALPKKNIMVIFTLDRNFFLEVPDEKELLPWILEIRKAQSICQSRIACSFTST